LLRILPCTRLSKPTTLRTSRRRNLILPNRLWSRPIRWNPFRCRDHCRLPMVFRVKLRPVLLRLLHSLLLHLHRRSPLFA
jgi:hypothetical protein